MSVALPPKLQLHCPALVVANGSLEVTLDGWGAVGVDVHWSITKDGVQVAKGKVVKTNCHSLVLSGITKVRFVLQKDLAPLTSQSSCWRREAELCCLRIRFTGKCWEQISWLKSLDGRSKVTVSGCFSA